MTIVVMLCACTCGIMNLHEKPTEYCGQCFYDILSNHTESLTFTITNVANHRTLSFSIFITRGSRVGFPLAL
jgi:hypothetical protein